MTTITPTTVNELVINKLTKAEYDAIQNPSTTELYLIPDTNDVPYPIERPNSVGTLSTALGIDPNIFYIWDDVTELYITLNVPSDNSVMNEYIVQFSTDSDTANPPIAFPSSLEWASDMNFQGGKTYQVSIVNGYAIGVEFDTIAQS